MRKLIAAMVLLLAVGVLAEDDYETVITPWGPVRRPKPRTPPATAPASTTSAAAAPPAVPVKPPPPPPASAPRGVADRVKLGINGSLGGVRCFPDDNPWNQDISRAPVDPNSDRIIASIGADKTVHPDFGSRGGFVWAVVDGRQPRVRVDFTYAGESDPGPYPIPPEIIVPARLHTDEKFDRQALVIDRDNGLLYEIFNGWPQEGGKWWKAGSGAIFDLSSNKLRPAGWTSADAAGLPIFAGLVRGDEVFEVGEIRHAVRFTVVRTRKAYLPPATHYASPHTDPALPPMGMRVRLKADYDISKFPRQAQIVLTALKKYGMILADNGSDWFITGAIDPRWDDDDLRTLKRVRGRDFEVVRMEGLVEGR